MPTSNSSIDLNKSELHAFWEMMKRTCLARGISLLDAEDIVGESIRYALETYDANRGHFRPYCYAIFKNRLINHYRDKDFGTFIWDDYIESKRLSDIDPRMYTTAEFDERMDGDTMLKYLAENLDAAEFKLLEELGRVTEETGKVLVSEAARRIGITELKGHDLFRKIQRKMRTLQKQWDKKERHAEKGAVKNNYENVPPFAIGAYCLSWNAVFLKYSLAERELDVFAMAAWYSRRTSFEKFIGSLNSEQRQLIAE